MAGGGWRQVEVASAGDELIPRSRLRAWLARMDAHAADLAPAWPIVLAVTLAVVAAGVAVGIPVGLLVNDDPGGYFRELMPGTWLSCALLLATAIAAGAVHRRDSGGRHWHGTFWGLSAGVFGTFAVVELTQPTVFLGRWLKHHAGAVAPWGIEDVDAFLLIILFAVVGLLLAQRALVLRRHPVTVLLLGFAVVLGAASQGLDSALANSSDWKVVAEESFKLAAEPFFLAAYLVALAAVLRRGCSKQP